MNTKAIGKKDLTLSRFSAFFLKIRQPQAVHFQEMSLAALGHRRCQQTEESKKDCNSVLGLNIKINLVEIVQPFCIQDPLCSMEIKWPNIHRPTCPSPHIVERKGGQHLPLSNQWTPSHVLILVDRAWLTPEQHQL